MINIFNKTLSLFLLAFLLSGCEKIDLSGYIDSDKSEENPVATKGFTQTFHVSSLTIESFEDASTRTAVPISELATVINLAIFKDGTKIKTISQKVSDKDFGTASINLEEGDYEIVCLAHSCSGNATISSPEKVTFPNNKVTDTFSYYARISVTEASEHNLMLKRTVAKFRLNIDVVIPEAVEQMKFYYTGGSSTLDAVTGRGCVNSKQTEIRTVGSHAAGQDFEIYTFPHDERGALNLTITAQKADGTAYFEREFKDVKVVRNCITTYTGSFFVIEADATENPFVIFGDGDWDNETTERI